MPEDANTDQEQGQIPTNMRLLLLLEEVARVGTPVSPADLGAALGLPKPTIHRLLHTCEAEGFLQRDLDGRSYGPGRRLRRLAVNILSSLHVRTARLAILNALADRVGETCNISTPDRESMIYLDRVETKWPLRIQLPIGTQVPFHCTASGKMYLSSLKPGYLDRIVSAAPLVRHTDKTITDPILLQAEIAAIRERGFSTDNEEFMDGMTAIAVPILDPQGRVVSTLSIHAPVQRRNLAALHADLPQLQKAAKDLSDLLVS
ncbi:IclR family transcriptional regulator [Oceaniglobus ichthyenteri]|uniref:IclR family transcriptional regulator n=1 Tax=Oceaniglobus ichthyenteri TaxID=2136177 RepID=UPI000D372DC6|nr:IclR family transcriptional regulator [Oceaniglobus ichthyenteri]